MINGTTRTKIPIKFKETLGNVQCQKSIRLKMTYNHKFQQRYNDRNVHISWNRQCGKGHFQACDNNDLSIFQLFQQRPTNIRMHPIHNFCNACCEQVNKANQISRALLIDQSEYFPLFHFENCAYRMLRIQRDHSILRCNSN